MSRSQRPPRHHRRDLGELGWTLIALAVTALLTFGAIQMMSLGA